MESSPRTPSPLPWVEVRLDTAGASSGRLSLKQERQIGQFLD